MYITEIECVYPAVRAEYSNIILVNFRLKRVTITVNSRYWKCVYQQSYRRDLQDLKH